LNAESDALSKSLPNAINVQGSDSIEKKESALLGFADGTVKQIITKPKIAGLGMNWQRCARMIFVGIGDSYEAYYQAIRRCWRFGQERSVKVYIVLSEGEGVIYENVLRKEREALEMQRELLTHIAQYERQELQSSNTIKTYQASQAMTLPSFLGADYASY
jgi:SNF2 family DNA or RNA helicase